MGKKRQGKKGLSDVVTTLIIILLVLIATGIIWVVIRNLVGEGSEDVSLGRFTLDLEIKSAYLDDSDLKVLVRRNVGEGDMIGIRFVFFDGENSIIVEREISMQELEERTFTFSSSEVGDVSSVQLVSIAPIFETSGGEERIGDIIDSVEVQDSPPSGVDGDDGTDDGGTGDACDNDGICEAGESETNCPNDCSTQACDNDGICEAGEDSNNCANDCTESTCDDDGICEAGETETDCPNDCSTQACNDNGVCEAGEDENNCPNDCTTQICDNDGICESSETPENCPNDCTAPSSCDGTWDGANEDDGVECDGGEHCLSTCTCESGYVPDGEGGCVPEPSLNFGTIDSVWPSGAPKYFDSNDLPKNQITMQDYIGKYVSFSGTEADSRCLQISYAEYLSDPAYNKSYIRLELVANISSGNAYEIWSSSTCGT